MQLHDKMIVVDLDGSLLRTDKTISEQTKQILNKCRQSDIKVIYATGRGGSAEKVAPSDLFDGRIIMNGAVAYIDNAVVYSRLIPCEMARPLLIACDKRGLKTASEIGGTSYTNFNKSEEWPGMTNYEIVDFSQHEKDGEKLFAVINSSEDVSFIESNLPKDLYLTVSRDNLGMIMHKDATKSKAVTALAQIWNIGQSEIVVFGDDLNDIDMLANAGVSVAMGNAVDEVKAISGNICLSNDEDGIADWIVKQDIIKV